MRWPAYQAGRSHVAAALLAVCLSTGMSWVPAGAEAHRLDTSPVEVHRPSAVQEQTAAGPLSIAQQPESLDLPGAALDVGWKLLVVLALVYVVLAALRRYTLGLPFARRHATLQVMESVGLGPNRGLYVVRLGTTHLLLGVTPGQISMLGQWTGDPVQREFQDQPAALADAQPLASRAQP